MKTDDKGPRRRRLPRRHRRQADGVRAQGQGRCSSPAGSTRRWPRTSSSSCTSLASISDDPIYMFVNSPGGHVESGDMIFDAIRFITPKVIMIGSGSVASAGALIYAAADKGKPLFAAQYPLPPAPAVGRHPGAGEQYRDLPPRDRADEGTPRPDLRRSHRADAGKDQRRHRARDFWLNAEEAVQYGLVNKIIVSEREITLPGQ